MEKNRRLVLRNHLRAHELEVFEHQRRHPLGADYQRGQRRRSVLDTGK